MKKWTLLFLLGIIFLGATSELLATHLVGGEVTYRCIAPGRYEIKMLIYRNCNNQSQGQFSLNAPLTIYRETEEGDFEILRFPNPETPQVNDSLNYIRVALSNDVEEISFPELPCLIPPNDVCVEIGTYLQVVDLPIIDQNYHVVYQRCCRNGSINNILDPGDTGSTYTTVITPTAQATCNNVPIFKEFPPIIICANESLSFDHSASDTEGDQLVYELCAPLKGGGLAGTTNVPGVATSCEGFIPTPACEPYFDPVDYLTPTYTALAPLAGDPAVSINPVTGIISGVPNIQGQFVVGVCVSEYRNGILLSTTQRDFQFNVENCDPLIQTSVQADESINNEQFVINQCEDSIINIFNQSFQEEFIDDFYWEFDVNGTTQIYNDWNLSVPFPGYGQYEGRLYLNPGTECGDTGYVQINIFPPVEAKFNAVYDTCLVDSVAFRDESILGGANIETYEWEFGTNQTSDTPNPTILFDEPGNYPVTLNIVDLNGCEGEIIDTVKYFPIPPLIIIEPSSFTGCPPANIIFENLSTPIDENYTIRWDFGDGKTSDLISPTHRYDETGIYNIAIDIESPLGCATSRSYPSWITISPAPIANFDYTPKELTNFNATVNFVDSSQFINSWYWDFDGERDNYTQNPSYTFRDTGLQEVTLIVTHPNNCADTLIQFIDIVPTTTYYMPNAFTPNGDGTNDIFTGVGYLDGIRNYRMEIWNRWGEQIFTSTDPKIGWNGTKNNTGQLNPSGVYICNVSFVGPRGTPMSYQEQIMLIR